LASVVGVAHEHQSSLEPNAPSHVSGPGTLCKSHSVLWWVLRYGLPRHGGHRLSDRMWAMWPPTTARLRCSMVRWWQGESSLYPLLLRNEDIQTW